MRHGLVGIGLLTLLLLVAQHAGADADDTFTLSVGAGIQRDSNLFRLSSSADPNAVLGKSTKADQIAISSLALKLSKPYSLQRFELDASLVDYRYRTFDHLSFTARNYAAAWRWSVTPELSGNLTSERKESLNSFADFRAFATRNLRTDANYRVDGVLDVGSGWRILGGVAQYTRTNSQPFEEEADNRLNTAEAGLRYVFGSGSSLSYSARSGRGDFVNRPQPLPFPLFLDNRFAQRENDVRLVWLVSGKTAIDARAGHLARTHAHFGERDYAGNVGHLGIDWSITGKTSLTARLARELSSFQAATSSDVVIDRLTLSPSWQLTARTAVRGRYDYAQLRYRGAIAATAGNDRADTLRSAMLGLEWQLLRALALSASWQFDKRATNQPGLDYASSLVSVSAQMTF